MSVRFCRISVGILSLYSLSFLVDTSLTFTFYNLRQFPFETLYFKEGPNQIRRPGISYRVQMTALVARSVFNSPLIQVKKFWKKTEGLQKAKIYSSIRGVTFVREKITRALRIQQPSDSFGGRISTSDLFILHTTHQLFISLFRSRHIHVNIPANISAAL